MLTKTTHIKKIIFYPAIIISTVLTSMLFLNFGSNIFAKIIWVSVGIVFQGLQVYSLLEWRNSKFRRKENMFMLTQYVILTGVSCMATIMFGLYDIKKQSVIEGLEIANLEIIDRKISEIEEKITANSRDTIEKQILQIQSQIPNVTYRVSERVAELNREVSVLRRKLTSLDNSEYIQTIGELKKQKAELMRAVTDTQGTFATFFSALGIKTELGMILFLFFTTLGIESAIFSTGSPGILPDTHKPNQNKKKEKNKLQLSLWNENTRKAG